MTRPPKSIILLLAGRVLAGLIQIFALYVIFHGHYSPGGGFQGGALLAASILLLRLCSGVQESQRQFKSTLATPLSAVGVLIYALVGLAPVLAGAAYLNYEFLPLPTSEPAEARSLGILLVEIGVGMGVMATLISIFDDLSQGTDG